jgi:hypothetical protein
MFIKNNALRSALTSFSSANIIPNMAQLAMRANIIEQAEYEESSPLTKVKISKKVQQRS